jgi:hypothetical protein
MDIENFLTTLVKQAAEEIVAETVYISSVKVIGSGEDLAQTLHNAQILSAAARQNFGVVSNSIIVGMGVYTTGSSTLQYHLTQDRKAKALYALSAAFSTSAIVSGGLAVASRTCQISGTAAISEACGLAFLRLGNKAHVTALQLEGKAVPLNLQKFIDPNLRPSSFPATGLSWVMPQSIPSTVIDFIPFEKIGHLVGFSITIYGYTRLSIFFYRYGKRVLRKFQSKRRSKLIKQQAVFLIVQIKRIISKRRLKSQRHILFCTS